MGTTDHEYGRLTESKNWKKYHLSWFIKIQPRHASSADGLVVSKQVKKAWASSSADSSSTELLSTSARFPCSIADHRHPTRLQLHRQESNPRHRRSEDQELRRRPIMKRRVVPKWPDAHALKLKHCYLRWCFFSLAVGLSEVPVSTVHWWLGSRSRRRFRERKTSTWRQLLGVQRTLHPLL
jgi:hypothetical protein